MFKYFNLSNPYFYIPLFLSFLTYFVLRAVFVNPFCDEIGTFFDYVETGNIWEETPNFSSANNHLLVTFIARFFYTIAGNNMFLFRLISLLSFALYFFICLKLIKETIKSPFNVLVFIGLISISWINDFFSYARGYAIAISLFLACIYLFIKWKNQFKIKWFVLILILAWLSVFANLAFLNSVFVILGYGIVLLVANYRKNSKSNFFIHLTSILLFVLTLLPLINYSFELKEAGALWWGNKLGWWDSTVKYLIELTLFDVDDRMFYLFLLLFTGLIIWTINEIRKQGFLPFTQSAKGIITVLFFGHVILTELLVIVVGVNYPSDRVAMIYVLFFLMVIGFVFDTNKKFNYFMFLFLFFPATFFYQMNLDTSVYMGHTRISSVSFDAIKKEMKISNSIDMDGLDYRNYVYEMRNQENVVIANVQNDPAYPIICFSKYIADVNDDWKPTKFHQLIFDEQESNGRLYRYTKKYKKSCVFDSTFSKIESSAEFLNLINEKSAAQLAPFKTFQISITGSVFFRERPMQFSMVYALKDDKTENKMYNTINIVNYCEFNKWLNFEWESPIYSTDDSSDKIACYFWNIEIKKVQLQDFKVQIFSLEEARLRD